MKAMRRSSSFKKAKERLSGLVGRSPVGGDHNHDATPIMKTIRAEGVVHDELAAPRDLAALTPHAESANASQSDEGRRLPGIPSQELAAVRALSTPEQRFANGAAVYVRRSSGEETLGFIERYTAASGVYEITLERPGSSLRKKATDDIRLAPPAAVAAIGVAPLGFAEGTRVFVQRSNGSESLGFVVLCDAAKGYYKLELDELGSGTFKYATPAMIRPASIVPGTSLSTGGGDTSAERSSLI